MNEKARYTPAYCEVANTLREFESAHRKWMNTSMFTAEGERAKAHKDASMLAYSQAYQRWQAEGK